MHVFNIYIYIHNVYMFFFFFLCCRALPQPSSKQDTQHKQVSTEQLNN